MKILLFIFGIVFFPYVETEEVRFEFKVDPESTVIISGSTNINSFDCDYVGAYNNEVMSVKGLVSGSLVHLKGANFKLNAKQFDCHISLMTKEFQQTLKADEYPTISMEIYKIDFHDEENYEEKKTHVDSYIKVTCAGISKRYKIQTLRELMENDDARFQGKFNILVEDFDIIPPSKAFGMVKVNSEMNIDYNFIFNR